MRLTESISTALNSPAKSAMIVGYVAVGLAAIALIVSIAAIARKG